MKPIFKMLSLLFFAQFMLMLNATCVVDVLFFFNYAGNAIANGTVPVMDKFCAGHDNAYTTLDASGLSVGLPAGLMGNSEVGHLNIGAGRVLYQVKAMI